jgi:transcriptional regulator with XRE-family HTH domain
MAANTREPGPVAQRVAANLRRLRDDRRLSTYALSKRLARLGAPIAGSGITKIETGVRGVYAEEVVSIALALGVSPNQLLMPEVRPLTNIDASAELTPSHSATIAHQWAWADGDYPLATVDTGPLSTAEFIHASKPQYGAYPLTAELGTEPAKLLHRAAVTSATMRETVRSALAEGVTPWQVRQVFEQAMINALRDREAENGSR